MADKIKSLDSIVDQLTLDNAQIQSILDLKQNECQQTEANKDSDINKLNGHKSTLIETSNNYAALPDEMPQSSQNSTDNDKNSVESNVSSVNEHLSNQFKEYAKNQAKRLNKQKRKKEKNIPTKNTRKEHKSCTQKVFVVGDSIVKNIDSTKISNAAGVEAACKSYSGAKITEIKEKLQQDYREGSKKIHSIILYVGTNNLVAEDVSDAAKDMEGLFVEAKKKADNVAVSGVIRRYDQKVTHAHIVQFNTKIHELCKKHRITFIENDAINKQNLNHSLLHLNKQGDRLLGGAFCRYLRSI